MTSFKYDIGLSVATGRIVWVNGGFHFKIHDIKLARRKLVKKKLLGKKIIGDKGDRDPRYFLHPLTIVNSAEF